MWAIRVVDSHNSGASPRIGLFCPRQPCLVSRHAGRPLTGKARGTALETYDAVAIKIRGYLSRNFLFSDHGFEYEDDASFLELGIIDSFAFVELLHWVEGAFSIAVADDELIPDNFDSVRKLCSFILGKKSGGT